jgi:mRNA interferase MazF
VIPLRQGEIWWAEAEDKRRPVLVVTRSEALPALDWVTVAPITRSSRPIPTHLALGPEEGLRVPCAATFDNLQPVRRVLLTERVGALDPSRRIEFCRAFRQVADC